MLKQGKKNLTYLPLALCDKTLFEPPLPRLRGLQAICLQWVQAETWRLSHPGMNHEKSSWSWMFLAPLWPFATATHSNAWCFSSDKNCGNSEQNIIEPCWTLPLCNTFFYWCRQRPCSNCPRLRLSNVVKQRRSFKLLHLQKERKKAIEKFEGIAFRISMFHNVSIHAMQNLDISRWPCTLHQYLPPFFG